MGSSLLYPKISSDVTIAAKQVPFFPSLPVFSTHTFDHSSLPDVEHKKSPDQLAQKPISFSILVPMVRNPNQDLRATIILPKPFHHYLTFLGCFSPPNFAGLQQSSSHWPGQQGDDLSLCDTGLCGGAYYAGGQAEDDADSPGCPPRPGLQVGQHVQAGTG